MRIGAGLLLVVASLRLIGEAGAQSRDTVVAWRIAATPTFRVGGSDATDTVAQFVRVTGAVRLSDGRVVVLAGDDTRWFDASGKYLYTSSRRGRGPGETQFTYGIARLAGDTVVIDQPRPLKQVFIAPTGKFAREEMGDDQKFRALRRWAECRGYFLPDLSHLACVRLDTTPRGPDPGPGLLRNYTRFVRVSRGLDSVASMGRDIGIEQFGISLGGRYTTFMIHPFFSRSYVAAGGSPLRIAIATNPEYEIEIWRTDGVLERTIRRANARRAPTPRERADADSVLPRSGTIGDAAKDPAIAARVRAEVPVPAQLPAVADLAIASTGEVLVGREGFLPSHPTTIVDVFGRTGNYLGILRLPRRFRMLDVGSDYILGQRLDENDAVIIEVYRLIKGPAR